MSSNLVVVNLVLHSGAPGNSQLKHKKKKKKKSHHYSKHCTTLGYIAVQGTVGNITVDSIKVPVYIMLKLQLMQRLTYSWQGTLYEDLLSMKELL